MVSNASKPVIGVTTYVEQTRYGIWDTAGPVLPRTYPDAVVRSGGLPALLPPIGDGAREIAHRLDGLVLSGGADIDPARYGQQPQPETAGLRPERDEFEVALFDEARAIGLPIFAVCRGMQLVNVALGGTLIQHVPDIVGHSEHRPTPGVFGTRRVTTLVGSRIARIVGSEAKVQCHHHQAIGELANGLFASAWSDDGTIEAIESHDGRGYLVGVQWHPEEDATDDRLFATLVAEATLYRSERNR